MDIVSNIYLKVMFKIFKTGHSPTPANLRRATFDYRAQDNQKGEEAAGFSKHSPLNMVFVQLSSELGNSKLMKILNLNKWRFPEMGGTPKSSILKGFSIINQPFWGSPMYGNPHMGKTHLSG